MKKREDRPAATKGRKGPYQGRPPKGRRPFKEFLLAMPDVGEDADFERIDDFGRDDPFAHEDS